MPFDNSRPERHAIGAGDPILQTLRRARVLLERGWCQHAVARDREHRMVPYDSPDAVSFCMGGAIHRASMEFDALQGALLAVQEVTGPAPISFANDAALRVCDVLPLLDRAIEARCKRLAARAELAG